MSEYTPPPWDLDVGELFIVKEGKLDIASICTGPGIDRETAFANARLIAAAPELLEALRSLTEEVSKYAYSPEFEHMGPLVMDARAAITKAKGD